MRLNETVPQISLSELLRKLSELGGSDLHITTGSPPQVRVDGHLRPLESYRVLTSADTKQLAYSVLTDAQKHRFEENLELDFSFGVKGLSRFRANLFNQRGAVGAVFRAIPYEIKAFEELGLPVVVKQLCEKPRGLILVTGPTGSGKSTTLAAMIRSEENLELDFSFGVKGLSRFRANLFNQRGAVGAVFRAIPYEIKAFEELGLPVVVKQLCEKPRGLILVTGPTGSGKSTTLAAMIDKINRDCHEHILTIEAPIESLHNHKGCLVNQREVNADTHGFAAALRTALRQDPDVVLIGEMRDLETIESALRIADTGHFTFATLHTNSAASTIKRIS